MNDDLVINKERGGAVSSSGGSRCRAPMESREEGPENVLILHGNKPFGQDLSSIIPEFSMK